MGGSENERRPEIVMRTRRRTRENTDTGSYCVERADDEVNVDSRSRWVDERMGWVRLPIEKKRSWKSWQLAGLKEGKNNNDFQAATKT